MTLTLELAAEGFRRMQSSQAYYTGLTGLTWDRYQENARRIAKVNFGCDFCEGSCAAQRNASSEWHSAEQACCNNCAHHGGYLRAIPMGSVDRYLELFSLETGFWRAGSGCILPHEMRSTVCLTYQCKAAAQVIGKSIRRKVEKRLLQIKPVAMAKATVTV